MIIKKPQTYASSMSTEEFGRAMSQLDLASIPPEKRIAALNDHLAKIMVAKIHDRGAAQDLFAAALERARRRV